MAGPPAGASHDDSWKASSAPPPAGNDANSGWEFPDLLATSEALAAEMLSESAAAAAAAVGGCYKRSSAMPVPPPPEFWLSVGDVDRHRLVFVAVGGPLAPAPNRGSPDDKTGSGSGCQRRCSKEALSVRVVLPAEFVSYTCRSGRPSSAFNGSRIAKKKEASATLRFSPPALHTYCHAPLAVACFLLSAIQGFRSTTKGLRCRGARSRWTRVDPRATSSTSISFL